jgi:MSHA biogenesis protein MshL
VQDGNIVALGGLMQLELENSRSGIPGVQQVPVVGGLFGNRARNTVKKELVILIKPTVIKSEADWEQDITATGERLRGMGGGAPAPGPRSQ